MYWVMRMSIKESTRNDSKLRFGELKTFKDLANLLAANSRDSISSAPA
jgi:hypothetical protein